MNMNETLTLIYDERGELVEADSPFLVFRLSWFAYLRETWAFVVRFFVCGLIAIGVEMGLVRIADMPKMDWLVLVGVAVAIAWTIYSIALTRSVRLFTNENGVWMRSGVFPWNIGISGLQWRDLGQAGFTQGFSSWALRSYDVRVSHRFTIGAALYVPHVHLGNLAVEHINEVMAHLQSRLMRA